MVNQPLFEPILPLTLTSELTDGLDEGVGVTSFGRGGRRRGLRPLQPHVRLDLFTTAPRHGLRGLRRLALLAQLLGRGGGQGPQALHLATPERYTDLIGPP